MKVLIVSDTHRQNENFMQVMDREEPIDLLIHCGDIEGSEYLISRRAGCPVHMVAGNNDFFSDLPREKEFQIGKYKVLLVHGNTYGVSMGNQELKQEARDRGVDIVIYGHTHKPVVDQDRDIIAVNPGSLTYPRQEGRSPSYIVMTITDGIKQDVSFEIRYL